MSRRVNVTPSSGSPMAKVSRFFALLTISEEALPEKFWQFMNFLGKEVDMSDWDKYAGMIHCYLSYKQGIWGSVERLITIIGIQ